MNPKAISTRETLNHSFWCYSHTGKFLGSTSDAETAQIIVMRAMNDAATPAGYVWVHNHKGKSVQVFTRTPGSRLIVRTELLTPNDAAKVINRAWVADQAHLRRIGKH